MKLVWRKFSFRGVRVTPRAGVWIETFCYAHKSGTFRVTPRAGVWIETNLYPRL